MNKRQMIGLALIMYHPKNFIKLVYAVFFFISLNKKYKNNLENENIPLLTIINTLLKTVT